jgi:hypothetical protein
MALQSVRSIVDNCLGKTGTLSIKQDVFGVYANDNPQKRSLKTRLDLIETKPFVRLAIVTIQGATPSLQLDLDSANLVYLNECDHWVYCQNSITANQPNLLFLNQNDCFGGIFHRVSDEEDQLFDLGRGLGADIVAYYINGDGGGNGGCAAHPDGRRGFWVGTTTSSFAFAHELTHILLGGGHVRDSNNLMFATTAFTNLPPDLTSRQCNQIGNDRDIESC